MTGVAAVGTSSQHPTCTGQGSRVTGVHSGVRCAAAARPRRPARAVRQDLMIRQSHTV